MKKAIIIMAHQKPEQINIFLKQLLFDKETYIFIHVNKLCESIIPSILRHERIIISKNNIVVHWGSDNFLKAELIMLREVLSYPIPFEYILINSGQELLVKKGLDEFLTKNKGKCFVDRDIFEHTAANDRRARAFLLYHWPEICRRQYDSKWNPFRILRRAHIEICKTGTCLFRKKIHYDFKDITFYKSFFWCALPRSIVEFLIHFAETEHEFMKIYNNALVAEEYFVATIVMMNPDLRWTMQYNSGNSYSLVYTKPHVNSHSPLLGKQDIEELENSGAFFARKFDIDYDKEVIEYFYNKITGKSGDENQ